VSSASVPSATSRPTTVETTLFVTEWMSAGASGDQPAQACS
jgi:hypothetical protein